MRAIPRGLKKTAGAANGAFPYPLLGAASRRFRGTSVARPALDLATGAGQRWQVMATYSLQPAWVQFLPPWGTEPVISSGSTRR